MNKRDCFCFQLLNPFFMASVTQRLTNTINILFALKFGSFFKTRLPIKLDYSWEFMGRDDRNVCTYFRIETDLDQDLINDFFLILTV